jgi:ferredoxin
MKPRIDPDLCIACGNCEDTCPEVFLLGDEAVAHVITENPGHELYGCVQDAIESCPTSAISVVEE